MDIITLEELRDSLAVATIECALYAQALEEATDRVAILRLLIETMEKART